MGKNKKVLANIAILLTVLFWGISTSSNKLAIREVPPSTLALIRFAIASLVLFIINRRLNPGVKVQKTDLPRMMLCGLIGVTIYFNFENYGVSLINAANATILLASIPLFTVILERIVFKKPIGFQKSVGIAMSIIGVICVIGNSLSINSSVKEMIGTLLMIGAALSWAIYSIISKKIEWKYPTIFLSYYQNLYGALFLIPFSLIEYKKWQPISMFTWGHIMYLALICSALCYFMYLFALKNLGATSTNIYINLLPFVGIIAAYIMLGEKLYPLQILGGGIIVLGVCIVNLEKEIDTDELLSSPEIS